MTHYANPDCADKGDTMSPDEVLSLAISNTARAAAEIGDSVGDAVMTELRSRGRLMPVYQAKNRRPLLEIFRDAMAWGRAYADAIPSHQWDEMRDTKASQYIFEMGAPPQLGDTFDKDDAQRLHEKVSQAIQAERRSGLVGMAPDHLALTAISTVFAYFHDRSVPGPSPMTIAVLKRALDLSPNIFSDPHGSKPVNDARAWLESLS